MGLYTWISLVVLLKIYNATRPGILTSSSPDSFPIMDPLGICSYPEAFRRNMHKFIAMKCVTVVIQLVVASYSV